MEPKKCSAFFESLTAPKRWEDLKTFGGSRVIRTAYFWFVLVPIAAKLIAPIAGLVVNIFGLSICVELPFSWRCFFLAALCFTVATLIYDIRCPWAIKRFAQPSEFLAAGFTRLRLSMELERLKTALEAIKTEDHEDMANLQKLLSGKGGYDDSNPDELRNFFITLTGYANHTYPSSRRAATLLYYAGFALLAAVMLQNVWSVVRILF